MLIHDLVGKERATLQHSAHRIPRLQIRRSRLSDARRLTRRQRALRLLNTLIERHVRDLSHRFLQTSPTTQSTHHNHRSLLLLHQSLLKMLAIPSLIASITHSIPDIVSTCFLPPSSLEKPCMSSRTKCALHSRLKHRLYVNKHTNDGVSMIQQTDWHES